MTPPSLATSTFRLAVATALLLLVPLLAAQFTSEMNWGAEDYLAAGALVFGAGLSYLVVARRLQSGVRRAAVAAAALLVLATVWAELAVGLFD